MLDDGIGGASITVNQDGIKSFFDALINAQTYEIYVDQRLVGELTGYQKTQTCRVAPGMHSVYVRAYARASASPARVYGYSQTLDVNLSAGEHKTLSCGLVPGPPLRKYLIFGGLFLSVLLLAGVGPVGRLTLRSKYALVALAALITLACGWYGYSSVPGANIYLKPAGERAR